MVGKNPATTAIVQKLDYGAVFLDAKVSI